MDTPIPPQTPPPAYTPQPGPSQAAAQVQAVKLPAIFMIVVAGLSMAYWLFSLAGHIFGFAATDPAEFGSFGEQPEWMTEEFIVGTGVIVSLIKLAINAVIIFGSIQMMRLQSSGLAWTAAVLSVIPCISQCCVLGIPFGIWAIVVLVKPEVKAAFS